MAKISLGEYGYRTPPAVPGPRGVNMPNTGETFARVGAGLQDSAARLIIQQKELEQKALREAEIARKEAQQAQAMAAQPEALNALDATAAGIVSGIADGTIHKDDAYKRWTDEAPKMVTEKLESLDPEFRGHVKTSLSRPMFNMGQGILRAVETRNRQDIGAGLDAYLGGLLQYAPTDLNYSIENGQKAIEGMGPSAGLSPEQIEGQKTKFRERAASTAVSEFMVRNRNNPAELEKVQVAIRNSAHLSPEAQNALDLRVQTYIEGAERRADAARRQLEAEQQKRNAIPASNLEIAVRRGQAGYKDIEQALENGVITPAKRTELVVYLDNERERAGKKATKQAEQIGLVETAIGGFRTLDYRSEEHRDAVDVHFSTVVAPSIVGLMPREMASVIADYSARTGIVPTIVKQQIRGSFRAGLPGIKAEAADLLDRLKTANPSVVDDFAAEDVALGNQITSYVAAGVLPLQAVKMAEEALAVPELERKARENRYRADKAPRKNEKRLQSELTGFRMLGPSLPGEIPDAMKGEFEAMTQAEFIRTGDLEVAQKTALDRLHGVWGVTSIGGRRWQKYAPETTYPVPGEKPDWIAEQLQAELTKGALWDGTPELLLQSDSITAREQKPSYIVLSRKDGVLNPVLGADGKALRFRPDYPSSPAGARRQNAMIEDAHKQFDDASKRYTDALNDPGATAADIAKAKNEADMLHEKLQSIMKPGAVKAQAPATSTGDDARKGELGVLKNSRGETNTEISITVTDERINEGKPTNIPTLVRGQVDVPSLQETMKPTREQEEIAIKRAVERVKAGASLPSYRNISEAEAAARARSKSKDTKEGFAATAPTKPRSSAAPVEDKAKKSAGAFKAYEEASKRYLKAIDSKTPKPELERLKAVSERLYEVWQKAMQ